MEELDPIAISQLPAADALTGAEIVAVVQGGVTNRTTLTAIINKIIETIRVDVVPADAEKEYAFTDATVVTIANWQSLYKPLFGNFAKFQVLVVDPADSTKYMGLVGIQPVYQTNGAGGTLSVSFNIGPFAQSGKILINA